MADDGPYVEGLADIHAAMMEELGAGRLDDLPLENRGGANFPVDHESLDRNRRARIVGTAENRQARKYAKKNAAWHSLEFDDVEEGEKCLNELDLGQAHRLRIQATVTPATRGQASGRSPRGNSRGRVMGHVGSHTVVSASNVAPMRGGRQSRRPNRARAAQAVQVLRSLPANNVPQRGSPSRNGSPARRRGARLESAYLQAFSATSGSLADESNVVAATSRAPTPSGSQVTGSTLADSIWAPNLATPEEFLRGSWPNRIPSSAANVSTSSTTPGPSSRPAPIQTSLRPQTVSATPVPIQTSLNPQTVSATPASVQTNLNSQAVTAVPPPIQTNLNPQTISAVPAPVQTNLNPQPVSLAPVIQTENFAKELPDKTTFSAFNIIWTASVKAEAKSIDLKTNTTLVRKRGAVRIVSMTLMDETTIKIIEVESEGGFLLRLPLSPPVKVKLDSPVACFNSMGNDGVSKRWFLAFQNSQDAAKVCTYIEEPEEDNTVDMAPVEDHEVPDLLNLDLEDIHIPTLFTASNDLLELMDSTELDVILNNLEASTSIMDQISGLLKGSEAGVLEDSEMNEAEAILRQFLSENSTVFKSLPSGMTSPYTRGLVLKLLSRIKEREEAFKAHRIQYTKEELVDLQSRALTVTTKLIPKEWINVRQESVRTPTESQHNLQMPAAGRVIRTTAQGQPIVQGTVQLRLRNNSIGMANQGINSNVNTTEKVNTTVEAKKENKPEHVNIAEKINSIVETQKEKEMKLGQPVDHNSNVDIAEKVKGIVENLKENKPLGRESPPVGRGLASSRFAQPSSTSAPAKKPTPKLQEDVPLREETEISGAFAQDKRHAPSTQQPALQKKEVVSKSTAKTGLASSMYATKPGSPLSTRALNVMPGNGPTNNRQGNRTIPTAFQDKTKDDVQSIIQDRLRKSLAKNR